MGDRIRAVIIKVHRLAKGPQIIVSRTDPSLLIRLFEGEIPEVYDGTVSIKNAVREGGERAKVAVASNDDTVDPVGACVGMKGSRINAIIRELRGEKIDIIKYSDDIVEYTINALNPAKISKVLVTDPVEKVLEVIVPEDQLSLAIGRKGQNVRLASKLLGWEIDIKGQEEKKLEIMGQMDQLKEADEPTPLTSVEGIGEVMRVRLEEAGITSAEQLAETSEEELREIPGVGEKTVEKLLGAVQALLEEKEMIADEVEELEELVDESEGNQEEEMSVAELLEKEESVSEIEETEPEEPESKEV